MTHLPTATLSTDQSNRSPGFLNFQLTLPLALTLKMASAQVVETSVTKNSPSQDSNHSDDLFQSRFVLESQCRFLAVAHSPFKPVFPYETSIAEGMLVECKEISRTDEGRRRSL